MIQVLFKTPKRICSQINTEDALRDLKEKGYLYIPTIQVRECNILGGQACIDDVWVDYNNEIFIIFKEIPGMFEYNDLVNDQKQLKKEFGDKKAVQVFF
jgi:hypothetical protein